MKVWVAAHGMSGKRKHYHTDRDCSRLKCANTVVEKELSMIDSHRDECKVCKGYDRWRGNSFELRDALLEMDPEGVA